MGWVFAWLLEGLGPATVLLFIGLAVLDAFGTKTLEPRRSFRQWRADRRQRYYEDRMP